MAPGHDHCASRAGQRPELSGIAYAQKSSSEPNHACHSQQNIFNGSDKRRRWRSTDSGEGSESRGVPDSASTSGTTTTPGPAFDMAAVLQATVQAAVRESHQRDSASPVTTDSSHACNRRRGDIAPGPFVRPNFVQTRQPSMRGFDVWTT
ncbi:hypothetical protein MTO96_030875 [Rhipicephalus appendiculatus]